MTPESPLFGSYEVQLDGQIAELAFTERINAALDAIDDYEGQSRDTRLMLDAWSIGSLVASSGMPNAANLGRSIYTDREQGNAHEQPTNASMRPGFDQFERNGVQCSTYVTKLRTGGHATASYDVYRLVVAPTGQKTLPDGRGHYIARSTQDKSIVIFQVKGESYGGREAPLAPGESYYPVLGMVNGDDRLPVLDELEKAATVTKAAPKRGTRW